jgi:predicted nucleic acid-binding protein
LRKSWVVDASVAVKLFLTEDLSDVAEKLFEGLGDGTLKRFFVPHLFYTECANIFWKHVRRFGYPAAYARQDLNDLKGLDLLSVSSTALVSAALDLALDCGISAYDATYAALARSLDIPLITADEKLTGKLAASEVDVRWLGELNP